MPPLFNYFLGCPVTGGEFQCIQSGIFNHNCSLLLVPVSSWTGYASPFPFRVVYILIDLSRPHRIPLAMSSPGCSACVSGECGILTLDLKYDRLHLPSVASSSTSTDRRITTRFSEKARIQPILKEFSDIYDVSGSSAYFPL